MGKFFFSENIILLMISYKKRMEWEEYFQEEGIAEAEFEENIQIL